MKRCLRCGRDYTERPSVSRRDGKTEICSGCGTTEALFDFTVHFILRDGNEKEKKAIQYLVEAERSWLNYVADEFMIGS